MRGALATWLGMTVSDQEPHGYVTLRIFTHTHSQVEASYRMVNKLIDADIHCITHLFASNLTAQQCHSILVRAVDAPKAKEVLGY